MAKVLLVARCADCPKNVSGDALARAMGRWPELRGKRLCSALSLFIDNVNRLLDGCPLDDESSFGGGPIRSDTLPNVNKTTEEKTEAASPATETRAQRTRR